MARLSLCDGCGKKIDEDNPLVAKLFITSVNGPVPKDAWSQYTSHLDVGKCCIVRVHQFGKWQQRKKMPQRSSRRRSAKTKPSQARKET